MPWCSHAQCCGVPVFFPCIALLGKHAKDCSSSRKRRNVSFKESLDSAGNSCGSCGHLRLDSGNYCIHVVFSAYNKNVLEGNHRQGRTSGAHVPHHWFKYVDVRKSCKFSFWSLCCVCIAWLTTHASIGILDLWQDLKLLPLALLLPFDIELSVWKWENS